MLCFKRRKSSKRKENNLEDQVEELEKKLKDLEGKMDEILEALRQGRITELKETEEDPNLKIQVEGNQSVLSDSPPKKWNGKDSEMGKHQQVNMVEDFEVSEDVNAQENKTEEIGEAEYVEESVFEQVESVNQQENKTEETGEDDYVEETVPEQLDSVNEQENETEQLGKDDYVEETVPEQVESVNEQENVCEQIGEGDGVEETVPAYVEGHQDEDSGTETVKLSGQDMYKRRIRFILIFVLLCALGMLLLWGVNRWGVCGWDLFMKWWSINAKIRLHGWLNLRRWQPILRRLRRVRVVVGMV
jgi:hypothetical protein